MKNNDIFNSIDRIRIDSNTKETILKDLLQGKEKRIFRNFIFNPYTKKMMVPILVLSITIAFIFVGLPIINRPTNDNIIIVTSDRTDTISGTDKPAVIVTSTPLATYETTPVPTLTSSPIEADTGGNSSNQYQLPITVEKVSWEIVDKEIPDQSHIVIIDVRSERMFHAIRTGGELHADIESKTEEDTAILFKIYNSQWSWDRRPVWVIFEGRKYAASIIGMPHGQDTITDNNMDGSLCLHFLDSKTHLTQEVDKLHQECIEEAYLAGKSR